MMEHKYHLITFSQKCEVCQTLTRQMLDGTPICSDKCADDYVDNPFREPVTTMVEGGEIERYYSRS